MKKILIYLTCALCFGFLLACGGSNENTDQLKKQVDSLMEAEYRDVTHAQDLSEVSYNLKDNEKALIIRTLKKCNGRRKDAAKELGFSERTLYRKIRDYGLD